MDINATCTKLHTRLEMKKQSTSLRSSLFRDSGALFVAHSSNEH